MQLHPYLSFTGCAKEAIELYCKALNGKIEHTATYAEQPEMLKTLPEGWGDKVMHTSMSAGEIVIMASDVVLGENGPCAIKELNYAASPVSLSINCASVEELESTFVILSAGGQVTMPPQDTFWGARFAMLVDKFGIKWMLNHDYPQK
jgi:PhnB protein